MTKADDIYAQPVAGVSDFVFDDKVVRVFPDMINRSVPGYALIVPSIGLLARRYAQPHTRLYDLGCSLGAATLAMRRAVQADSVEIVAVDNSAAMIERCENIVSDDNSLIPVNLQLADINDLSIRNASVVVLNFTLQFLAPDAREALLTRVAEGLVKGGVMVLSEKLCFADSRTQALQTDWHHDYKRAQGYSDLEIAQKRSALENVMRPDTEEQHFARFNAAGFSQALRWFQCFSFASYIAFK